MLKKILIFIVLGFSMNLFAKEINVKSKLEMAKIFLHGVELTHSANADINSIGNHEIVFEGFSSNIRENSLQVSSSGDLIILSVKSRTNYLKASEKTKEVLVLEDSLKYLNLQKLKQQNEKDVDYMEIELLNENRKLSGDDKSINVKELQQFSKYYVEKIKELKNSILNLDSKLDEINKNIVRITNQLNEINKKINQPSVEVIVTVAANKTGIYNFKISYMNNNAGWNPSYDVRAKDITSPVILNYKAEIFQNTGLEWNNVKLILSTRNQSENSNKPELYAWYLDFQNEIGRSWGNGAERVMMEKMAPVQMDAAALPSIEDFIQINNTQLAVEFDIQTAYTIPSDNKPHSIALREYKLPARFEYYAAPKLVSDAFLIAYIDEWKGLSLLPGHVNIYFENSFVGQTVIDPFTTEKDLTISLGRDKSIIIERNLLKDFTEDKFLSSDVERQFAYEIKIKNDKYTNIKLILEEPFPISKNEDIKVKIINAGGAHTDNIRGIFKWTLEISPSENINRQFIYSVRYPSDKIVPGI